MNQDKSLVPAYILEILRNHSSEEHPLRHKEIGAMLESEYGIKMDRTTVSRNISTLAGAGLIETNSKGNGCYYDDRALDDSELRLLIHSVICNSAIPSRQAKDLIERLCAAGGKTSGQNRHYYIDPDGHYIDLADRWERSGNQELFRNIEIIDTAIAENVQIRFDYYGYGTDKKLHKKETCVVSPYNIILSEQRYFLMATGERRDVMRFFRIHLIRNIEKTDLKMTPLEDTAEYTFDTDLGHIDAEASYLLKKEPQMITFRTDKGMLDEVIDRFGTDIVINTDPVEPQDISGIHAFAVRVLHEIEVSFRANPAEVERWALHHLDRVEIIAPKSLRDDVRWDLSNGLKRYGGAPVIKFKMKPPK